MPPNQTKTELKQSPFYQYHQATKHTIQKLYSSGHRLDWESQPNPFLRFDGAQLVDLPHEFSVSKDDFFTTAISLVLGARSGITSGAGDCKVEAPQNLLQFISNLLFYGTAISAWKQVVGTNNRWALRVNASSGNLHPTDTHVLVGPRCDAEDNSCEPGAYHYYAREHKLEKRLSGDFITPLMRRLGVQSIAPPVVLCLTSIFFREAWKYRDRAFRYCQHDLGHALASLSLSACALGWSMRIIGIFPDDEVSEFFGLNASDEKPLAVVLLAPQSKALFPPHKSLDSFLEAKGDDAVGTGTDAEKTATALVSLGAFAGRPTQLSSRIIDYPKIEKVYDATKFDAVACKSARLLQRQFYGESNMPERGEFKLRAPKPGPIKPAAQPHSLHFNLERAREICKHNSVHQTIRKRRSAVDMDGKSGMTLEDLTYILRTSTFGFPADFQGVDQVADGEWKSSAREHLIHLYLYVHRVDGLEAGLYYFDRFENQLVPLLLRDQREGAKETSCFQDIACDGAFSLSMIADFEEGYRLYKDRCYRLAHYEAGYIGQMLYLAACALGHDATGIGCFIDDDINNYLVLDEGKEVIYNFTFGKAVHDPRLTTLPAYQFPTPEF